MCASLNLVHALFFSEFGCEAAQADIAAANLKGRFNYDGVTLYYLKDNQKIPARECRGLLAEHYPFLFKQADAGSPSDPLTRAALTSTSLAVRGRSLKAIGDKSKADAIAREWGLQSAHDMKTIGVAPGEQPLPNTDKKSALSPADNPFLHGAPNTDASGRYTSSAFVRQAALVRQDKQRAVDMARRAGVTIGSARAPQPA